MDGTWTQGKAHIHLLALTKSGSDLPQDIVVNSTRFAHLMQVHSTMDRSRPSALATAACVTLLYTISGESLIPKKNSGRGRDEELHCSLLASS